MKVDLTPDLKAAALVGIREILTEENTDEVIDMLVDRISLPFWLRWLPLRSILDQLLPAALLKLFEDILSHEG